MNLIYKNNIFFVRLLKYIIIYSVILTIYTYIFICIIDLTLWDNGNLEQLKDILILLS